MKAVEAMDTDFTFGYGMSKAFVQVGLVPFAGHVVDNPSEVFFRHWTGAEPGAMLSARAAGQLTPLLQLQQQNLMSVADLINDCNLLELAHDCEDERDAGLFEEEEEEAETEEDEGKQ